MAHVQFRAFIRSGREKYFYPECNECFLSRLQKRFAMRRGTKFGKKKCLVFLCKIYGREFFYIYNTYWVIYISCVTIDTYALIFFRTFDAMVPFISCVQHSLFGSVEVDLGIKGTVLEIYKIPNIRYFNRGWMLKFVFGCQH